MSHPVGPVPAAGPEVSLLPWALEPVVVVSVLAAGLYLRGWITLSRRMPERFGASRLAASMAGLACLFATAMLFWRPVILPWPAHSAWPRWAMIPYLVLADLQNSVLAAVLTFSDRVIYSAYEAVPRAQGFSALEDQAIAGVVMWVPGSLAFLLPVLWIVATMSPREPDRMSTAPLR